ncbi:hypothetical protein [Enterobacter mori]
MKILKLYLSIVVCSLAFTVLAANTQPVAVAQPVQKVPTSESVKFLAGPVKREGKTVNILYQGNTIASFSVPADVPLSVSGSTSTTSADGKKITYRGNVQFLMQLADNQRIAVHAGEAEFIAD